MITSEASLGLDHDRPLTIRKWAGQQDGTEVRSSTFEWGVCTTCFDYERGEVLFHADLLTGEGPAPSDL